MQLGLILTAGTARGNLDLAVRAERVGFDTVLSVEFFNQHAFAVLGAIAASTTRIRLGSGIANAFTRAPLVHATAAMDLDELSGGRMILGLGSGTRRMNVDWWGVPFAKPAARMRELVMLLRAAFAAASGFGFRFSGQFWDLTIPVFSRPGARADLPIWVAAVNPPMLRAAGAAADGVVGHPIATRRWHREVTLPTLRAAETAAGRRAGACRLVPYVMTAINTDRAQAVQDAKQQIGFYYTVKVYHTILRLHGLPEVGDACRAALATFDIGAMAAAIPDALVDEIAIACTPDEAPDRLARWRELCDEVLLYAPTVGVPPERVRASNQAILDVFGRSV
jgi:probable F420-dependent oxidoreductase